MTKLFSIFISFALLFSSTLHAQFCTDGDRFSELSYFTADQIESELNVVYGNAINGLGNPEDLLFDIYYPKLEEDDLAQRPFILMIHGGGFVNGNKNGLRVVCEEFARKGFVSATMSYRLGPTQNLAAVYRAEQDAHAAMRYVVDNASVYGVDTSWMFVGGRSAGALTALNLTYVDQTDWNFINPTLLNDLGRIDTSGNNSQSTFTIKAIYNNWGSASPTTIAPEEMVPMISFHGELDTTVPIDTSVNGNVGSRVLHDMLVEQGVCSDLTIQPDGGHGIYTDPDGRLFRTNKASCFFKSLFCEDCTTVSVNEPIPANCSTITSTGNPTAQREVRVYPNPFRDRIYVESSQQNQAFTLYDVRGQVLLSGTGIENISLADLPAGIYFLSLPKPEKYQTFKLVKH